MLAAADLAVDQDRETADQAEGDLLAAVLDQREEIVRAPKSALQHHVRHIGHNGEQRQHRQPREQENAVAAILLSRPDESDDSCPEQAA